MNKFDIGRVQLIKTVLYISILQAIGKYWASMVHVLAPGRQDLLKSCVAGQSMYLHQFPSLEEAYKFNEACLEDYHCYMEEREKLKLKTEASALYCLSC